MKTILDEIVENKRREVEELKRQLTISLPRRFLAGSKGLWFSQ